MDVHRRLDKECAAYKAYIKLPAPPNAAPNFDMNRKGYPVVNLGEVFCRMPGRNQGHCGRKLTRRDNLLQHLEGYHGLPRENRPKVDGKDPLFIQNAMEYYIDAMRDENYEGKRNAVVGRPLGSKATKRITKPARNSTATAEQQTSTITTPSIDLIGESDSSDDTPNVKAEAPTSISTDSNEEQPQNVQHVGKSPAPQYTVGTSSQTQCSPNSDDEDLELQIEEDELRLRADETRLRLLENKRKLAARKKQRQERQ